MARAPVFSGLKPAPERLFDTVKWHDLEGRFGREDVLPLWLADIGFASPEPVRDALVARVSQPFYGYERAGVGGKEAFQLWMQGRHGWAPREDEISFVTGGLTALGMALEVLSAPGDSVIVLSPVYPGFFEVIAQTGRVSVPCPLLESAAGYRLDEAKIEAAAQAGAKVLLLCHPHNPIGKVYRPEELRWLLDIAARYGLKVVSDEVHADLSFPEVPYRPLGAVAGGGVPILSLFSPGKTFNLQGFGLSVLVGAPSLVAQLRGLMRRRMMARPGPLAYVAAEAAWREGGPWLDALLGEVQRHVKMVTAALDGSVIGWAPHEGTSLIWLDGRTLEGTPLAGDAFWVARCGLGLHPGVGYGPGGEGWVRMQLAYPRPVIADAVGRIRAGLASLEMGAL